MSIYSDFADRIEDLNLNRRQLANTREAELVVFNDEETGAKLLGIRYSCDFRSEEESGVGAMSELFTRTADESSFMVKEYILKEGNKGLLDGMIQANLVSEYNGFVGFAASDYIYDARSEFEQAIQYIRNAESWKKDGGASVRKYKAMTVVQLKAEAKARGLKGYSKLKSGELVEILIKNDDTVSEGKNKAATDAESRPAWFHNGELLVLRKTDDLFGEVLQRLVEAADAGFLVVGGGAVGFGSGFSLFDSRDLTQAQIDKISEANRWHREQMEALKPVAEIVEQGPMSNRWGMAYYALHNPSIIGGEVKYWLNGASVTFPNGRSDQPYGWYTLQELLDEKYMIDAAKNSDEKILEFDSNGSYRPKKLTREQAEEELKSKGLIFALTPEGKLATK